MSRLSVMSSDFSGDVWPIEEHDTDAIPMKGFFDIYDMAYVPWWQRPVVKVAFWALLVAAIVLVAWYIVRRFLARRRPLEPWVQAHDALEVLGKPEMLGQATGKLFYTRLIDVLKLYIHRRYGYDIQGKTDREIIVYLEQQVSFPRDLVPVLGDLCDHALLVKFAHVTESVERMKADIDLARRVIKETTPRETT